MDRAVLDLGSDAVRVAVRPLPLLTSRRHIDLVRVCSAASSPCVGGPAPA
ncbi:putative leader peptide [Streptomyces spiralis]